MSSIVALAVLEIDEVADDLEDVALGEDRVARAAPRCPNL